MKLLSLWEPWATLMAIGAKKIETRSWATSYRGWLAIQASKGGLKQLDLCETCCEEPFLSAMRGVVPASVKGGFEFPRGCIVAVVNLETCCPTHHIDRAFPGILTARERAFGDYSDGRYGWITKDLFRLPEPIPFKAKQGLCDVTPEVIERIRQQWRSANGASELAARINAATPEEITQAMEKLPTDALEWAVRFEALGQEEK